MFQKIHLLSDELCNKIAAGEVIQRPASVVKELIENSIDSGADDIKIYLRGGGRDEITVSDNGSGMGEDDMLMAFERHASSKISEFSELDKIESMGFRGEALASIAGISRVECSSGGGDGAGFRLRIDGGKVVDMAPVSHAAGTVMTVRSLFFNVPARKKFLKDEQTEYRHCLDTIRRIILIQRKIRFRLEHNGREILQISSPDGLQRIRELFGDRQAGKSITLNYNSGDIMIRGWIGHPENARNRGAEQHFYVNRRVVIDRRINAVIYSAYSEFLDRGLYPFFLIHVQIPTAEIDVNVHPAKTEIKFRRERAVFETIKNTVRSHLKQALQQEISSRIPPGTERSMVGSTSGESDMDSAIDVFSRPSASMPRQRGEQLNINSSSSPAFNGGEDSFDLDKRMALFDSSLSGRNRQNTGKLQPKLWQAHKTYIFAEISSGVIIVDQHLAHFRILYDESMKKLALSSGSSQAQQLLFPISIELNMMDWSMFLEVQPMLEKLGFGLRIFGERTLIIDAVPQEARTVDEGKLLINILDEFKDRRSSKNPHHHDLAAAYADRSAIKRGEKLSESEMQSLIDRLFGSENPYYCPRGRSIMVNTSLKELAVKFK